MVKVGSYAQNIRIYNPYYLFHSIALQLIKKYGSKIDLDILKEQYPDFYWNCILYFSLNGYSYDMMIKYKKENKEEKENRNNNFENGNNNKKRVF